MGKGSENGVHTQFLAKVMTFLGLKQKDMSHDGKCCKDSLIILMAVFIEVGLFLKKLQSTLKIAPLFRFILFHTISYEYAKASLL